MGTLMRLRRLLLGGGERANTIGSAALGATRAQPGMLLPDPGPFSTPPAELVTLIDDVPWELREDPEDP